MTLATRVLNGFFDRSLTKVKQSWRLLTYASRLIRACPSISDPRGKCLSEAKTFPLVKQEAFEAIRMVIRKDHEMPGH